MPITRLKGIPGKLVFSGIPFIFTLLSSFHATTVDFKKKDGKEGDDIILSK